MNAHPSWHHFLTRHPELSGASELIAVRAETLCLVRTMSQLWIVDAAEGSYEELAIDIGRLGDAFDEINRRWVARGGDEFFAGLESRMRSAIESGDAEQVRRHIHPEFVAIDHRPIGLGIRNVDEYINSIAPLLEFGLTMLTLDYLRTGDGAAVSDAAFVMPDGSTLYALMVAVHDGEHLVRYEMFPTDASDAAIARFEEILSQGA